MEQVNQKKDKSFLDKVKENTEDDCKSLNLCPSWCRRVEWFIITLNYVDLPMIKKGQSGGL